MKRGPIKIFNKFASVFSGFYRSAIIFVLSVPLGFLSFIDAYGQNPSKTFPAGSYIINMGITSQTIKNGLKPYGLVYDLLVNKGIPVNWAVNSSKAPDGIDFMADGLNYSGGSFIISAEKITPTVLTAINTWKTKGVIVVGPVAAGFSAPVFKELTSWPIAVLDEFNDVLISPYYTNAGIPTSSYIMNANPTMLSTCLGGDLYILPHTDPLSWVPAWVTALKNYVNNGGYLYASCLAVSILENLPGCNFLSSTGLVPWDTHSDGTVPFTYLSSPAGSGYPAMQFMRKLDGATLGPAYEKIYLPKTTWRPSTTLAVYDPNYKNTIPNPDVAYTYPNAAAVVVYGRAFGDNNKGIVMYEGGHEYTKQGTVVEQVAAQRAFFNFVLMAAFDKQIIADITTYPDFLEPGATYPFQATVSGGTPPYTYEWSSDGGGTFKTATSNPTNFTAPSTIGTIVIKVKVSDSCGKISYASMVMNQGSTVQCLSNAVTPVPPSGLKNQCGNPILFTPASPPYVDNPDPVTCEGSRVYSWTYTDYASCPSTSPFTRTWKYKYNIRRTTPPSEAGGPVAKSSTVECASSAIAPPVLPVVKDVCGNTLSSGTPVVGGTYTICEGTKTYSYTYIDCTGLSFVWSYVYTIDDTTPPTGTAPADISGLQCIANIPLADVSSITDEADNCGGPVSVTVADANNGGSGSPGSPYIVTRTYKLMDCSGLTKNLVQTITVIDDQPPTFTVSPPCAFCVENLVSASFISNDLKINPDPDYYLIKSGSKDLDIANISDNCCSLPNDQLDIRWEIVFSSGEPKVSGTGQFSTWGSDIKLWGDGVNYAPLTHQIRYWVKDCHGNELPTPVTQTITINPRPTIDTK